MFAHPVTAHDVCVSLMQLKEHGIRNVLALRGDPPKGQDNFVQVEGGFACALDLVKYIRREHGDYFGIAVAGYPEAHPDAISQDAEEQDAAYWKDIHYLKEKVRTSRNDTRHACFVMHAASQTNMWMCCSASAGRRWW